MAIGNIYGNTISLAEKALDFQWAKQKVISNNISNIDTPGYKSRFITFEEQFGSKIRAAAGTKNRKEIGSTINNAGWRMHVTNTETARLDGNNVQPDVELVEMSRTALQYQHLMTSVNSDIRRLSTCIKGQ